MTNQIGSSWQITFTPFNHDDEIASSFFEEYFEVISLEFDDDDNEICIAYTSTEPNMVEIEKAAKAWGVSLPPHKIEFIPPTNWLTKNVIKFAPIETEDFIIYGSHEENTPDTKNKIPVKIYAATAFGSGQHQTTKSCLNLLSELKNHNINNTLDMGCGSGILALAVLKLWKNSTAIAADIDDEAVIVTLQNAADNELADRITAFQSNGYQNPNIAKNNPYDLVLSNILARPLIEMAPELSKNLKIGGYAILSGFIDEQVDWVKEAHEKTGLKLLKIFEDENWRAILMEKTK